MASRPYLRVLGCVFILMALSAGAVANHGAPRIVVLCGLAALAMLALLHRALRALETHKRVAVEEMPPGIPTDQSSLIKTFTAMEAQLEHAPVALFRIAQSRGERAMPAVEKATPLNAYARRIIAPGRASNLDDLYGKLLAQRSGRHNMISFDTERGLERAQVSISMMTVNGVAQRIAALLPMESELETAAQQAWQQLVHVLTHEIMNSLTPVASLSRTAHDLLDEMLAARRLELVQETGQDLATALDAISRRSESLVAFVANYRSLSSLAASQPERLHVGNLFSRLSALVTSGWQARGGKTIFTVEPSSLEMLIDPGQLEQALINLLQNAAEACAGVSRPEVTVSARLSRGGRLLLEVHDNGPGVPEELIAHIFTPFFSTKTKGSGIGLAMVRQLIHGNGGTVRYVKSAGGGARFVVTF